MSVTITELFTASRTWISPITGTIQVECWGQGGGGGGTAQTGGGGGGAGGQYAINTAYSVVKGVSYAIAPGTSGGAGGAGASDGSAGTDSTFDGSGVVAKGGAKGLSRANGSTGGVGSTSGGVGGTVYKGGDASNGTSGSGNSGSGGGGAGTTGNGGSASGSTAGTGTANLGGDGGAGKTASGNGNPGSSTNYGGGGSGGYNSSGSTSRTGGAGRQGAVRIQYTAPSPRTATAPDLWLMAGVGCFSDAGTTGNAGATTLQQWNDISGNGKNASQSTAGNRPTFNVSPDRVSFSTGATSYLTNAYTGDVKTFAIVYKNTAASGYGTIAAGKNSSGGHELDAYYIGPVTDDTGSSGEDTWMNHPATFKRCTSADPATGGAAADGTCHALRINSAYCVISGRITNNHVQLFMNGALVAQKRYTGTLLNINAAVIGTAYFAQAITTDYFDGDLKEVLMFSGALSDSEFAALNSALLSDYSISAYNTSILGAYTYGGFLGSDPDHELLIFGTGADGVNFSFYNTSYYPSSGSVVRDVSTLRRSDSEFYVAHTTETAPFTGSTSFAIAKSTDNLQTFSKVTDVDCGAVAHAWGPKWFVDGVTYYVYFTDGTSQYVIQPTDVNGFTTWGTKSAITVSGQSGSIIDGFMIKAGSTYYFWYVVTGVGHGPGYGTNSSPTGTFTKVADASTDTWSFRSSLATRYSVSGGAANVAIEGTNLMRLASGAWRLYFDVYDAAGNFYGVHYADSSNTFVTFTAPTPVVISSGNILRNGAIIQARVPFVAACARRQWKRPVYQR